MRYKKEGFLIKKILLVCVIVICVLATLGSGESILEDQNDDTQNSGLRMTFIIGTILQPSIQNTTVQAKALSIFYYNASILHSEMGVVGGLTPVRFEDGLLFFMFTPGPFEKIYYIYGFTPEFSILPDV